MSLSSAQDEITVEANAKVNFALNIVGKRGDMHLIDTVIVPIGISDTVTVKRRRDGACRVRYACGSIFHKDTAQLMAEKIANYYLTDGVDVFITKRIPLSNGLGGSTADAVGVAHAMRELFGLPDIDDALLLSVGSDAPAMYRRAPVRARGLGERVERVSVPHLYAALITSITGVNTKDAYAAYDRLGGEGKDIDGFLMDWEAPANALQRAAEALNPKIARYGELLKEAGFSNVVMSGSGSAYLGYTKNKSDYLTYVKKLNSLCGARLDIASMGFEIEKTE